jgi:hypothetical protein
MSLHDMRLAHVPYTEHETKMAVPLAYNGIATEEQRLSALFGTGQFGKHYAHHEGLYHDTHYALETHDEDGFWTLLGGVPGPIPAMKPSYGCQ